MDTMCAVYSYGSLTDGMHSVVRDRYGSRMGMCNQESCRMAGRWRMETTKRLPI
jgi:hypothetical protein